MILAYCIHSLHSSGGMERVLSLKASYLAEMPDYEVHIITACLKGRKPFFPLSEKVILHDLGVSDHGAGQKYSRKLEECLKSIKADICISLCGGDVHVLGDLKDGSHKIAEFHFSHDKFMLKYGSNVLGRIYARLRTRKLERSLAKLEAFVVLTEEDCRVWKNLLGKVYQIYNPLTFKSDKRSDLANNRFIAAGRLESQKNYPDMIRAWALVARRYPDWHLDIYGSGSEERKLRRMIQSLGIEGCVNLMGRTNDIRSEMMKSSALLLSSRFEGFPMVLLEAQATGLPIVSYSCPCGPSEIVEDGTSGILVPPGDIEGLAEGICVLIGNPELLSNYGKASYEASERFDMDHIMRKWTALFRNITCS